MSAATVAVGKMEPPGAPIRRYRVTVGFRHPTDLATLTATQLDSPPIGDSGLRIPADVTFVYGPRSGGGGDDLRVLFKRNEAGRLAQARVVELRAPNTAQARAIVMPIIGMVLSRLAFDYGALVVQHWIEVIGLDSGYRELGLIHRGADVELERWPEWAEIPPPFFRSAFAVYREGLSSTNAFYALLCYQRVIDGVRHYRGLLSKYAKTHGIAPNRSKLLLEAEEGIFGPMADMIGDSCDRVADRLYEEYRVPAAHGVRADEPLLAADQLQVENRYWVAIGAARQVARKMLAAEWDFRARLGADPIPELDEATFA